MDEYLLFEYLLFNIHFSPCSLKMHKGAGISKKTQSHSE